MKELKPILHLIKKESKYFIRLNSAPVYRRKF